MVYAKNIVVRRKVCKWELVEVLNLQKKLGFAAYRKICKLQIPKSQKRLGPRIENSQSVTFAEGPQF